MTSGTVATPHAAATAAGARALEEGGNAVDAALAAAAVLTVAYPHNCALGGDLFALVRAPDGRVRSINASGRAARRADRAALRRNAPVMPLTGVATITVPGLVAGWRALHERGAALDWSRALAAGEEHAGGGVDVAPGLAEAIHEAAPDWAAGSPIAELLAPGGRALAPGDRLVQPRLADTLHQLGNEGAEAFYRGEIGHRLVAGLERLGSVLTRADLADFTAQSSLPLAVQIGGTEVLTSPPNSSGVLLAQALVAVAASGVRKPLTAGAGTLARIFAAGSEQRDRMLGDHPFTASPWLGDARIAEILHGARVSVPYGRPPGGDTAAVVTADGDGRAVSLVQSLFRSFGAQVLEPSTGILLHNRGASFSLDPDHPNVLAGGRRPAHTLMPVLVQRDGALLGVLGTMGGKVHAQVNTQVLLNLLDGLSPADAVAAPRFAIGPMEAGEPAGTVRVEADHDPAVATALRAAGFDAVQVPRHSSYLGHAQAIWLHPIRQGGSDPRADGRVLTVG